MPKNSLRHELRSATRDAHERLDAMVGVLDSVPRYRRFVLGLHRYRQPVEAAMRSAAWPAAFGTWRPTSIADDLARDLADIGEPVPQPPPHAGSMVTEELAGISYVLEGSSLGARVLVRQASALGFDGGHGARHLARQAADIGNWQSFLRIVEELDGLDRVRVVEAANASFAAAARAMAEVEHV